MGPWAPRDDQLAMGPGHLRIANSLWAPWEPWAWAWAMVRSLWPTMGAMGHGPKGPWPPAKELGSSTPQSPLEFSGSDLPRKLGELDSSTPRVPRVIVEFYYMTTCSHDHFIFFQIRPPEESLHQTCRTFRGESDSSTLEASGGLLVIVFEASRQTLENAA